MKVALILSGQYRCFKRNIILQNMIKQYDIDTFVTISKNHSNDEMLNDFIRLYNVKALCIHNKTIEELIPRGLTREYLKARTQWSTREYNCLSMFYCHQNNIKMLADYEKENGFNYQYVIYARTDIQFSSMIPIHILEYVKDNTVYIPASADHTGLNDQMAFGNRKSMEIYCNVYNNFYDYIVKDNILYHPETLNFHHVYKSGLNVARFIFNYSLYPDRNSTIE